MNIVITGATGFIGSHLANYLTKDGHNVFAIIRPSSDANKLDKKITIYKYDGKILKLIDFFRHNNIDGVIHLAAHCPTSHNGADIPKLINANILFGTEVLEAATEGNVRWFINTGSYMQHYNDQEYSPSILYAATKQAFLNITKYWSNTKKIKIATLELFDNFGPNDHRKKIFTLWKEGFKKNQPIDMSPGQQIIDVSPVENVVEAFTSLAILLQNSQDDTYNGAVFSLQSENRMTLKDLAELFQKIAQKNLKINWGGRDYRDREIMQPWTKGQAIPGYRPAITLEEAIKKYLEIK